MEPIYSVVIPVYNEQEVVQAAYERVSGVMRSLNENYEIIFINDGSRDRTAHIVAEICKNDTSVQLICFSRNFGHMAALTAGMDYARGQAVIVIDADLQDPPEVIPDMIREWKSGYDVVYGKRRSRKGETYFKKLTASFFYRFLQRMTDVDLPVDTGEFRLIDRKVCDAMKRLNERNRYVRGLVSWVGFKQTAVEYDRQERYAGETKYPLRKMIKFALDAITTFSYKPLKLATSLGTLISVFSFIYLLIVFIQRIFTDTTITGWASTVAIILFSQGIVMLMLGLMGEYIGRIFEEIKGRPIYIVSELIGGEENDGKGNRGV